MTIPNIIGEHGVNSFEDKDGNRYSVIQTNEGIDGVVFLTLQCRRVKPISLKQGNWYKTRDGRKVHCFAVVDNPFRPAERVAFVFATAFTTERYYLDGRVKQVGKTRYDIVAEWNECDE